MCSPRAPPVTLSSPGLPPPAAIADVANASMSSAPARAAMSRILDIEVVLLDPRAVVLGRTSVPRANGRVIGVWPHRAMGLLVPRVSYRRQPLRKASTA